MTKTPLNRTTWNKGLKTGPLSDEHKQKLSLSKKGKMPKNFSECLRKAHLAAKGRTPWNKGIPATEEHKRKTSATKKKLYAEGKIKVWSTGLTKDTDIRVKMCADKKVGIKRDDMKGEKNWNWTGNNNAHYDTIYHYEARKVLERHYKLRWKDMCKPKDSVIHHIDTNYTNNQFDNLCVMSRSDHTKLHFGGFK